MKLNAYLLLFWFTCVVAKSVNKKNSLRSVRVHSILDALRTTLDSVPDNTNPSLSKVRFGSSRRDSGTSSDNNGNNGSDRNFYHNAMSGDPVCAPIRTSNGTSEPIISGVFQNDDRCGLGMTSSEDRVNLATKIVNGYEASVAEFPWVVALLFGGAWSASCGGSLITPEWVLTAAHCVADISDTCEVMVRVGEHNFHSNSELHQDIAVADIIIHVAYEKYITHALQYDIALMRLQRPARVEHGHINTLCLAPPELQRPAPNSRCVVAGWGVTNYGSYDVSHVLRWTELTVLPPYMCGDIRRRTQLCAMGRGPGMQVGDSCQGDSGGALFCQDDGIPSSLRYFQIGIVSFGTSNSCGYAFAPAVYTNVLAYRSWIENVIQASSKR